MSGPSTSIPVTIDTAAPTVAVTFPANSGNYNAGGWTGTITGTATDATSGISGSSAISLTITQSSSGKTWNGSTFATGANTVTATSYTSGTGAFTYTFPHTDFPADGSYTVSASAIDGAGNTGTSATNTFKYDTAAPTVAVTFPANSGNYNAGGWTGTITGTATDATSGISGASAISLTITQSSSGKTWNGSTFATGANTVTATSYTSGTGAFTYTFPHTDFPADGSYTVSASAIDGAGNTGTSATNTFKYDTAAPTVSVTFPANSGNYNAGGWTGTITGTATDATSGISGASAISLTITQSSSGKTWNGSTFATGANTVTATSYTSGTGAFTYTFPQRRLPR